MACWLSISRLEVGAVYNESTEVINTRPELAMHTAGKTDVTSNNLYPLIGTVKVIK